MEAGKKGIFTLPKWKLIIIVFLLLFSLTLLFEILFNLRDWQQYFTLRSLASRFIRAGLIALAVSLVINQRLNSKKDVK